MAIDNFPKTYEINLGSTTGTCIFECDALNIPDKFIVVFDKINVIDTGYRGLVIQQTNLNNALIALGVPTETITGGSIYSTSFIKTTSTTKAYVKIYSPLPNIGFSFKLKCPVST